ncbi:MAG: hypothetical protein AAF607_03920 [Pseudomonadota bacterium]
MFTRFFLSLSRFYNALRGGNPNWTRSAQMGLEYLERCYAWTVVNAEKPPSKRSPRVEKTWEHRIADMLWMGITGQSLHCFDSVQGIYSELPESLQKVVKPYLDLTHQLHTLGVEVQLTLGDT